MSPILLADDDDAGALLVVRAFRDAGVDHPLVVVTDGQAVMDYVAGRGAYADRVEHPLPCLLLLDQTLPGSSGLDVLEWLRSRSPVPTLPTLMLSASTYDSDVRAAYLLGANGYLVKPLAYEDMVALARAVKDYWLVRNRAFTRPSPAPR